MCACAYVGVHAEAHNIGAENHLRLLLHCAHQGRASQFDSELTGMASLASQLVVGIPPLPPHSRARITYQLLPIPHPVCYGI